MTKEEYKKNLIRYFDSVRGGEEDPKHMGEANCGGISCGYCIFEQLCTNMYTPEGALHYVELLEKWAKEHPAITNKEKIEELFGVKIDPKHGCPPVVGRCGDSDCEECRKWWNEEYQTPKKGAQDESD